MEIALIIEIVKLGAIIIPAAIAVVKHFKAKKYKEAMNLSDETLKGIVAAIELMPDTPLTLSLIHI